ncbi:hypothetical protein K457DRAFT_26296 [Linnemannia elongata AG-77]|uniref:Galactose oxidase n=1 Tax=Linnemannia elongata AG-77 TaxID=1314771 RepID=A0A197JAQ9_9FUNG|nr:hypothetical protein K457DRAFT_26296 [Linnemannia elongata AG-77]
MKLSIQLFGLMFCGLLLSISAGSSPKTAFFGAYATVEESTLYIQGGIDTDSSGDLYDQFYSLDLTQSWDTSSPPWSEVLTVGSIPAGLKGARGHSISLSRKQKTLTFWNINGSDAHAASFHLSTNSWEQLPTFFMPKQKLNNVQICTAVADPRTDQVYIPGASDRGMLVYSLESKSSSIREMERTAKNSTFWSGYSFVWSSNTSGSAAPPLAGSCMVPAYSGTKMLVFGGFDVFAEAGIDTLYILDVPTLTWSLGGKYQPRTGMVCSVSGDYLIVWGGMGISQSKGDSGKVIPADETLIIYNIKTAQWTTQYLTSDNSNKIAAIIGGSGGAVVVIILIAGVVVFRKRRRRQHQKQEIQVSSPLQLRPEQDIEKEPVEKAYFQDIQPRPASAITPQATLQTTQSFRNTPPNTSHSNSPQYVYAQGPQQVSMDPPSWPTSTSPSQRVQSVSSSRSTSTLVATPTIPASPRYPSYQQQHRSPQQQQSFNLSPPARRITRNPQGRNTPEPTSDSNHTIQYQINALQAEVNRLQANLHH